MEETHKQDCPCPNNMTCKDLCCVPYKYLGSIELNSLLSKLAFGISIVDLILNLALIAGW